MTEVLLVCMPFGPVFRPSIGLSLLKAGLAREGIDARVLYFSIDFAARVGRAFYSGISNGERPLYRDLAGEWIFASDIFRHGRRETEAYVREVLRRGRTPANGGGASDALVAKVLKARRAVGPFLDSCAEEVLAYGPRLVGFSSMFQQHTASLALARRIREKRPETTIVFGGANCEGEMGAETVRRFPFVDAAVSGEGDIVFPKLVKRVLASRSLRGLPGVLTRPPRRAASSRVPPSAPVVLHLDELPDPDHSDFFEQYGASRYNREWLPSLPFETARGCWWGQKRPCLFCGVNGRTLQYRSKSPRRALDELVRLTDRHPDCDVGMTDAVLDPRYFDSLLPQLAERSLRAGLSWETRSNLKKEQLRVLATAGVRALQPGIESLGDAILALMRKGVTGLQNIQMLKWCREVGIHVYWNVLWGFPDEPPEEYERMARLVPLLTHLPPPLAYGTIRLDRFSPLFRDRHRFGLVDVEPLAPYRHVYPLPDSALLNLAQFFQFRYREPRDVPGYVRPLEKALDRWVRRATRSDFFSVEVDDRLLLWDFRPPAREPLTVLDGLDKALYRAADAARSLRQLAGAVGQGRPTGRVLEDCRERLERLAHRRLILKDGARYLALALPLGERTPKPAVAESFAESVARLGRRVRGGVIVSLEATGARRARRPVNTCRSRRSARRRRARVLTVSDFSFPNRGELFVRLGPESNVP